MMSGRPPSEPLSSLKRATRFIISAREIPNLGSVSTIVLPDCLILVAVEREEPGRRVLRCQNILANTIRAKQRYVCNSSQSGNPPCTLETAFLSPSGHERGVPAQLTMLVPKQRRSNAAFDRYSKAPRGAVSFMRGLSTRRFFAFGLVAAGAVSLASRLRFSSANAIETTARAFPIAPVVPKTFRAFGGARIDNYDWLRDRKDPRV